MFRTTKKLYLSSNQLQTLPEGVFAGLERLELLFLRENQLQVLLKEVFSGLVNLRELYLNGNQLQVLPEEIFSGLINLRELHLSNNQLRALPESVFVQLKRLELLGLSCLQLRALPENIFSSLERLKFLGLSCLQLRALPASFFGLSQGCKINLTRNRFSRAIVERIRQRAGDRLRIEISVYEPPRFAQRDFSGYIQELRLVAQSHDERDLLFDEGEKGHFVSFMHRIQNSLVYRGAARCATARLLLDCFSFALDDQAFRDVFFMILDEASRSCGDRVALGVNNCYIQYLLYTRTLPQGMILKDFIIGLKRLELLDQEAIRFIAQYRGVIDPLEVHLGLQVHLRELLKLPVYAKDMLYFACSALTQEALDRIAQRAIRATEDIESIIRDNPIWEEYIKKIFQREIDGILSGEEFQLKDADSFGNDQAYQQHVQQVQEERKQRIAQFVAAKTRELLGYRED